MLDRDLIDKYYCAGSIARSAMFLAEKLVNELENPEDIDSIGPQIDAFVASQMDLHYPKIEGSKGLARPTDIFGHYLEDHAVIYKICIGVQIDGCVVMFAHTVCPNREHDPVTIDAMAASKIATEAVIALLGTVLQGQVVTGRELKYVVEQVARELNCMIVPMTTIRRQLPYNYGQQGMPLDHKGVDWKSPLNDFVVSPDEVWLVDIAMTPKGTMEKFEECVTSYFFPATLNYPVSINFAKRGEVPAHLEEFFARLSANPMPQRRAQIECPELQECIDRDLVIPWRYPRILKPCPKESTTVLLLSAESARSGKPTALRLVGGSQFPLKSVQRHREVKDKTILSLLSVKYATGQDLVYAEVHGA